MDLRDGFTHVGGQLLGRGSDSNVLPRSGYDKETALQHFSVKLDEHEHSAEAVRLTPNALKNLAKSDNDNRFSATKQGIEYD